LRFALEDGVLSFSPRATELLNSHRQLDPADCEACGVLLGRLFNEVHDAVVDDISEPQIQDTRSRFNVFRSSEHSRIALERWKASQGFELLLGLWHTHPERDPTPSTDDYADWKQLLLKGRYEGSRLFFLIVGTSRSRCWEGSVARKRIRRTVQFRECNLVEE